jgi:two-component system chemotaxis response regulator CheB
MNHDMIAIGASAGGLEVLLDIVPDLPADLPASLFVAMHMAPGQPSMLPELLSARGKLPARHPLHDEQILPGHIYVAPPDNQLLVRAGTMEVVRGPKENGHRPAADALFRTASTAYGPRVVGVVLAGYQDCGTAGMMSIKARGGLSVVQDPASTLMADMPRSVIEKVAVDFVVPPKEITALLVRLATTPAPEPRNPGSALDRIEGKEPGEAAEVACPICQGVLSETSKGKFQHFRCHVGHTFTLEALAREQTEEVDRALWSAVRALEEGSALSARLRDSCIGEMRRRFAERALTQGHQAELIRRILLHGAWPAPQEARGV